MCLLHGGYTDVGKGCPLCPGGTKAPKRDGPTSTLDAVREEAGKVKAMLEVVKMRVGMLSLEAEALERERDSLTQALVDAAFIIGREGPFPHPSRIHVHPKRGIEGFCPDCDKWHTWKHWLKEWGYEKDV